jgi:hypothetical protein
MDVCKQGYNMDVCNKDIDDRVVVVFELSDVLIVGWLIGWIVCVDVS